jgi:peptide/nickel transport system permease protein
VGGARVGFVGYALRRIALMALVIFGVTLITFVLTHIVPVNPVLAYVGDHAPPSVALAVERQMGLNRPLPVQYGLYLWNLVHGNLGISIANQMPVSYDLGLYLPATIELSSAALVVVVVVGIFTGVLSALFRNTWVDQLARVFALGGVSLPVFFTALVFLAIFYVELGWLPGPGELSPYLAPPPHITGMVVLDALLSGDWPAFWNALSHLVLPAVVLGWASTGVVARMVRSSLLDAMSSEHIRTARAKGLHHVQVVLRHGLRNALIPTVTVLGLSYGSLLQGAVLTETIFAWPGIGRFATLSVTEVDVPAVLGVTLVAALIYSLVNLIVDLLYAVLDPRISYA